ncbi:covalently-linked cell wall protein-like protein [Phyllosticta citriasiana]|uniref:Covalently-linked cell wall protein-like protein n=1 Tax=Phyllosticta citriasiana TaxID=595635 RepID=A0ABR1KKJ5_9PEZI
MKYASVLSALAGAALALPQGVTEVIQPKASSPDGCEQSYSGSFSITIVNATTSAGLSKRGLAARQESGGPADTTLVVTLADGQLTDQKGRTGYIASNFQLQFDDPPQAGAIYTGGFSACSNSSIALGGSTVFYACPSGEGATKFYNFYDRSWASTCSAIHINIISGAGDTGSSGTGVPARSDGQPVATEVPVRSDGQPIASAVPVRSDGQPIASAVPVRSDGQPIASAVPVRSDGQPIATPVPIRSDGQPIASAYPAPVPVRSDGQPIAVNTPTPVSIRTDGQPIATGAVSNNLSAPAATTPPTVPAPYTGGAQRFNIGSGVALVGAAAVAIAMI